MGRHRSPPPLAPGAVRTALNAPVDATLAAVYLGVLPSAAGFVVWGHAVARLTVTAATAALYLVPVVALAVAGVWLGERPRPVELLGGLIGIAGVALVNRRPRPERARTAAGTSPRAVPTRRRS